MKQRSKEILDAIQGGEVPPSATNEEWWDIAVARCEQILDNDLSQIGLPEDVSFVIPENSVVRRQSR
jgi:hypothetical protein